MNLKKKTTTNVLEQTYLGCTLVDGLQTHYGNNLQQSA